MPLYKLSPDGAFLPFEEKPFGDLEKKLEEWVEANPHLIVGEGTLVVFGRQVTTKFGRIVDLMAIDETAAVVVIELKVRETPRQVIAQALEYAAWADSLGLGELNEIAKHYTSRRGGESKDLVSLYRSAFEGCDSEVEAGEEDAVDRLTFNDRQRIVIVAEDFSGEVEQTLRYLRSRMGVDISGLRFGIHESGPDLLIETELLVGREPATSAARKVSRSTSTFTDEELIERATSPFVRASVGRIEEWINGLGLPNVELSISSRSERRIFVSGKRTSAFYYARDWIYCWLHPFTAEEAAALRSRLSRPSEVIEARRGYIRFHLATSEDLAVYKEMLERRFKTVTAGTGVGLASEGSFEGR